MNTPIRGRGSVSNPPNRFEPLHIAPDLEQREDVDPGSPATIYLRDFSKSVISSNTSPDIPFDRSLNPYRGCEHGCIYCYARPTHEYFGLSAGLDFETRIFVKEDAPALLRAELCAESWEPQLIALSGVTDPYQPIERRLGLTRGCLEVLAEVRNPVSVITKNALVTRDLDLLEELARHRAVSVSLSVTTLDEHVRRVMEPRTSTAANRLEAIAALRARNIPVGVSVAPVVPGITDHEIPEILKQAAAAGAQHASFIMLRLPFGVKDLFERWLEEHFPERRQKVLHRIAELRGGRLNDPRFGSRMSGAGPWAETVGGIFHAARERAGMSTSFPALSTQAFKRTRGQLALGFE